MDNSQVTRFRVGTIIKTHDHREMKIESFLFERFEDGFCQRRLMVLTEEEIEFYQHQGFSVSKGVSWEVGGRIVNDVTLYAYIYVTEYDLAHIEPMSSDAMWVNMMAFNYHFYCKELEARYEANLKKRKTEVFQCVINEKPYEIPPLFADDVAVEKQNADAQQPEKTATARYGVFKDNPFLAAVDVDKLAEAFRQVGEALLATDNKTSRTDGTFSDVDLSAYLFFVVVTSRLGRSNFEYNGKSVFYRFIKALVFPELRVGSAALAKNIREKEKYLGHKVDKSVDKNSSHYKRFNMVMKTFKGTSYYMELFPDK